MNAELNKKTAPVLYGSLKRVPQVDNTLTKDGFYADAKAVGDRFAEHKRRIDGIDPHFAENVGYDNTDSGMGATNVQGAINELNWAKCRRAYEYSVEISRGDTGYCTFDVTPYVEDKCIGIISICGSENRTSLAVVVWGKNYDCNLCDLIVSASSDLTISRSGNVFTVNKTSGGIWGADMSIIRVPSTF